jgi:hypothetical protein
MNEIGNGGRTVAKTVVRHSNNLAGPRCFRKRQLQGLISFAFSLD